MPGDDDVLKKSSSGGCLCGGIMNLFKRPRRHVSVNKQQDEEKNTDEAEKLNEFCLKQREDQIKSAKLLCPVDSSSSSSSSMITTLQLEDLLDEFTSLKRRLQSLAHDVAELKADTLYYSGRVNYDHTHFTSTPMTSLYDRGDIVAKPRLFDDQDDYYTSCHYANSHHLDEEYGGTTATGRMYP